MNSDEPKKINVLIILEVLGRPPEHLTLTLENLTKQIDEEKGVSIKKKEIKEPVPMKEKVGSLEKGKNEPAHVEIISPEKISLTNNEFNEVFNELTRRLHGYNEVARTIQVEKEILERKLREITGEKKEE